MKQDNISEIFIDETERLCIKPEKEKFTGIYRTAMEVHWDDRGQFLYSPREWSYLDWYKHIVSTAKNECGCQLRISADTKWSGIPEELREGIEIFDGQL